MEICIDEFSPESTDELNHEYEIIERIGSGAFGTVMHAVETSTNRECAIKVINKSGKNVISVTTLFITVLILRLSILNGLIIFSRPYFISLVLVV